MFDMAIRKTSSFVCISAVLSKIQLTTRARLISDRALCVLFIKHR